MLAVFPVESLVLLPDPESFPKVNCFHLEKSISPALYETRLFQWLSAQFGKPEFLSDQCLSFLSVLTRD